MFEREIRTSLAKLERLAVLLPDNDTQKKKAENDLNQLNEQFGKLVMLEE